MQEALKVLRTVKPQRSLQASISKAPKLTYPGETKGHCEASAESRNIYKMGMGMSGGDCQLMWETPFYVGGPVTGQGILEWRVLSNGNLLFLPCNLLCFFLAICVQWP